MVKVAANSGVPRSAFVSGRIDAETELGFRPATYLLIAFNILFAPSLTGNSVLAAAFNAASCVTK